MLDDLHAGRGRDDGAHGGQVHGGGAVAASADDVGGLAADIQRNGMGGHRLGRATDLIRRQAQLLLRGEHGSHGGGIGIALHQVVDEPLGFLGVQMVAPNQLREDRLPCDLGHDAPP